MGLSIFLAKFLGIYMLIVAAICLLRRNELENVTREIFNSKGLLALSGSLSLLFTTQRT